MTEVQSTNVRAILSKARGLSKAERADLYRTIRAGLSPIGFLVAVLAEYGALTPQA